MPSGSITSVRYPAAFSGGVTLRNVKAEPKNPGISTTGWPPSGPAATTCSDSFGATGMVRLCALSVASAVSSCSTSTGVAFLVRQRRRAGCNRIEVPAQGIHLELKPEVEQQQPHHVRGEVDAEDHEEHRAIGHPQAEVQGKTLHSGIELRAVGDRPVE